MGSSPEEELEMIANYQKNFCHFDERNPGNIRHIYNAEELSRLATENCRCENCFYGRHELAEYIEVLKGKADYLTREVAKLATEAVARDLEYARLEREVAEAMKEMRQ